MDGCLLSVYVALLLLSVHCMTYVVTTNLPTAKRWKFCRRMSDATQQKMFRTSPRVVQNRSLRVLLGLKHFSWSHMKSGIRWVTVGTRGLMCLKQCLGGSSKNTRILGSSLERIAVAVTNIICYLCQCLWLIDAELFVAKYGGRTAHFNLVAAPRCICALSHTLTEQAL